MENARQYFGGIQSFNVFRELCFILPFFILVFLWWLSLFTLVWMLAECLIKSASICPDTCNKSRVAECETLHKRLWKNHQPLQLMIINDAFNDLFTWRYTCVSVRMIVRVILLRVRVQFWASRTLCFLCILSLRYNPCSIVAPLLGYAQTMNCLEHQICMLAHLLAFPNLFLDSSIWGFVYRREFFIDSKHAGEQQVSSPFGWRFRDKFWALNICTPRQYTDVFHCEGTPLFPLILISREQWGFCNTSCRIV